MNIRELRKPKYWSQDQLAQMSGLSVRTIQRIEREAVDAVGIITAEQTDEVRKEAYAEDVKGLYKLTALAIFALGFTIVVVADETTGWGFVGLMAVSWVVIIGVYAMNTFDFFGDDWKTKLWARKSSDSIGNDK